MTHTYIHTYTHTHTGRRMTAATDLADGGEEGVGSVVLIGSDCPFITPGVCVCVCVWIDVIFFFR
jgi:hypothetical protein